MSRAQIHGCGTALVTPFTPEGKLDHSAFRALVDWQIEQGIHFLVPCGSTGEAATLSLGEHLEVVRMTVEQAADRVPVVAGVGGNDTAATVELTKVVSDQGASHLMVASPPYNRPPQRGLIAHFEAIADAAGVPILLYNVPGRTASNIAAETTLELAVHSNIVGIKEASGNMLSLIHI